jgi:hypothetical protein
VTGGTHGDANGPGFDLDFEWFFDDELVRLLARRLAGNPFENGTLLGVQREKDVVAKGMFPVFPDERDCEEE